MEAAIPGVGEVEGVKGLAEFSIHNYDLEEPAEISKKKIVSTINFFFLFDN